MGIYLIAYLHAQVSANGCNWLILSFFLCSPHLLKTCFQQTNHKYYNKLYLGILLLELRMTQEAKLWRDANFATNICLNYIHIVVFLTLREAVHSCCYSRWNRNKKNGSCSTLPDLREVSVGKLLQLRYLGMGRI